MTFLVRVRLFVIRVGLDDFNVIVGLLMALVNSALFREFDEDQTHFSRIFLSAACRRTAADYALGCVCESV